MIALTSAGGLFERLRPLIYQFRSSVLWRDRMSLAMVGAAAAFSLLALLLALVQIRPTPYPVPLRYSSLTPGGIELLGPWYYQYATSLFAAVTTLLNTMLAVLIAPKSKIAAFFLLVGAVVVGLFSLVITNAFTVRS